MRSILYSTNFWLCNLLRRVGISSKAFTNEALEVTPSNFRYVRGDLALVIGLQSIRPQCADSKIIWQSCLRTTRTKNKWRKRSHSSQVFISISKPYTYIEIMLIVFVDLGNRAPHTLTPFAPTLASLVAVSEFSCHRLRWLSQNEYQQRFHTVMIYIIMYMVTTRNVDYDIPYIMCLSWKDTPRASEQWKYCRFKPMAGYDRTYGRARWHLPLRSTRIESSDSVVHIVNPSYSLLSQPKVEQEAKKTK